MSVKLFYLVISTAFFAENIGNKPLIQGVKLQYNVMFMSVFNESLGMKVVGI